MHYLRLRSTIIFLSLVAVFLLLQLFRFPFTPILFEGDHTVQMSNAWRMFLGETAFRDFFLVTFPGTEFYYLVLFKVFGVKQWLLNATIFLLLMGLSAVCLFFSRKVLVGWAVYLPVSIFLVIGFRPLGIDGSHRFFSVLAVFTAAAIIFSRRNLARLFLAGVFCGLASSFTQPRGLMGLLAIISFLVVEKFYTKQSLPEFAKSILAVTIPFALIIAFIFTYFIAVAGFDSFYYATFVFPVKHYPADDWNNFRAYFKDVPNFAAQSIFPFFKQALPLLFVYFLIPAVYFLFAIILWFKHRTLEIEIKLRLIFINLLGFFLAAGISSAPSATRLYQVSIPGLISLVWIFQLFAPRQKIMLFFLSALGLLGFSYTVQRQIVPVYPLDTPSGSIVSLSPDNLERYQWAALHTEPFDYFYEAHHPSLYSIFHLKNPTPISWIRANNFTTEEHVSGIIEGLKRNQPRYIIWNGLWSEVNPDQAPDFHLQPLSDYLKTNYHPIENPSDYKDNKNEVEYKIEIWEKN